MPTYTYKCTACEDVIEKRQSFSDPPLTTCEQCGGALRKVIHPVGIVFKGSGWYITDSRSSSNSANGRTGSSSDTDSSSSTKSTETKSETKSESSPKTESSGSSTSSTSSAKAPSKE